MTLNEIEKLLQKASGGIDRIYEHWTGCDGSVVNLPDYTVVIDRTGGYHVMHEDFTEKLAHTWHRNSQSIGIAMAILMQKLRKLTDMVSVAESLICVGICCTYRITAMAAC